MSNPMAPGILRTMSNEVVQANEPDPESERADEMTAAKAEKFLEKRGISFRAEAGVVGSAAVEKAVAERRERGGK